jgi:ABC-type bacteriocin/lantibiotic exporter with double-glycine peptidase domain
MIKMKYYKQNTIISCGPVVLQMIFHYYGKYFSEETLTNKLRPNSDVGTPHYRMINLATSEGFYVYANEGSSLYEIAYFVNEGIPVIVHFIEPDTEDGHYAVVVGVQKKNVVLNDPWNGEKFKMDKAEFEKRWVSLDGKHKRWIMAVSDTDVHFGKQYLPNKA